MKTLVRNILIIVLLVTCYQAKSQDDISGGSSAYIKKGDRFFKKNDYDNAIKHYRKAEKLLPNSKIVKLKIAESYRKSHQYTASENAYSRVIDSVSHLPYEYYLNYAQLLTHNGKYEQAKVWLEYYDRETGGNEYTDKQLNFLNNRAYYQSHSDQYTIIPATFNTQYSEYSPLITNEGVLIVSDRNASAVDDAGRAYSELFLVKFSSDSISKSITSLLKVEKRKFHDGPGTMVDNRLIFTRSNESGINKNILRLYQSNRDSTGEWSKPIPLNLMKHGVAEGHPTISNDGKQLVFVSDINGNKDLYRSEKIGDDWSKPTRLGGMVNTIGNEMFPYFHNDTVLYFASDGHAGLGGLDIYKMFLTGLDSGQVLSLGEPVNSPQDDFGITLSQDGDYGFISSSREGGFGKDDIYKISTQKTKTVYMEGFTKAGTKSSESNLGNVLIYDKLTNRNLGKSDENGFFKVALQDDKEYSFALKALDKEGYEINSHYYEIAFEGIIKNKVDTNHIVHLIITDSETKDTIYKRSEDQLFTYFVLEKEKAYNFQASTDLNQDIDISDIEFEGFIKGTKEPIVITEMEIVDTKSKIKLFQSDKNGYFRFPMKNGVNYSIMPQVQVVKKIDIWMEGYMKVPDGEFIPPILHVQNIEGEHYEFENYTGYFGFPAKEGQAYILKTTPPDLENDYNTANQLHFVGFAQDGSQLVSIGKVSVYDAKTHQLLFETDEVGYFDFDLEPNVNYQFVAKTADGDSTVSNIKFDGVVKDQGDTLTYAKVSIKDLKDNTEIVKQDMEGFFNFELVENQTYGVNTRAIPIKKDVLQEVNLLAFSANNIFKQVLLQDVHSNKIFEIKQKGNTYYYTDGVVNRELVTKSDSGVYDLKTVSQLLNSEGWIVNDTSVFRSLYYEYNSSQLSEEGKKELDDLIRFLNRYPTIKMVVSSHADSRGSSAYNKILTDKRNQEVISYLSNRGVSENRIKAISNGDLESLQSCEACSEKDHGLNRRTDFHVISF